jgi:hypothetical protein
MSVTSGGTAAKPLRVGGNCAGSAASAGMSMTFFTFQVRPPLPASRYHIQIDDDRSLREITTPTKP